MAASSMRGRPWPRGPSRRWLRSRAARHRRGHQGCRRLPSFSSGRNALDPHALGHGRDGHVAAGCLRGSVHGSRSEGAGVNAQGLTNTLWAMDKMGMQVPAVFEALCTAAAQTAQGSIWLPHQCRGSVPGSLAHLITSLMSRAPACRPGPRTRLSLLALNALGFERWHCRGSVRSHRTGRARQRHMGKWVTTTTKGQESVPETADINCGLPRRGAPLHPQAPLCGGLTSAPSILEAGEAAQPAL